MGEDEAEAVLVVLAEPLEWVNPTGNPNAFGARAGQAAYVYHYSAEKQLFHVRYSPDVQGYGKGQPYTQYKQDMTDRYYDSAAEAKAACEIHAATGQFPPGVEVVESA